MRKRSLLETALFCRTGGCAQHNFSLRTVVAEHWRSQQFFQTTPHNKCIPEFSVRVFACLLVVVEVYAWEHCRYLIAKALCVCSFRLLMFGVFPLVRVHIFHKKIFRSNILPPQCLLFSKHRNGGAVARKTRSQKGLRNHKGVKTPAASQLQMKWSRFPLVSGYSYSHLVSIPVLVGCPVSCCHKRSLVQWSL